MDVELIIDGPRMIERLQAELAKIPGMTEEQAKRMSVKHARRMERARARWARRHRAEIERFGTVPIPPPVVESPVTRAALDLP